jgi:hypothetical protein
MKRTLILLATSASLFASIQHSSAITDDVFTGDQRFAAKQTVKASAVTLSELLADLSAKTGIKLAAGTRVADDKVVLYAHDRPLNVTLNALAKFFGFTWEREGPEGSPAYRLTQTFAQMRAEEEELKAEEYRAADQILKELAICRKYAGQSEDERRNLILRLRANAQDESDPVKRIGLSMEASVLEALQRSSAQGIAARFLSQLSREGIVRLLGTDMLRLDWPRVLHSESLPPELRVEIVEMVRKQNLRTGNPLAQFNYARMEFKKSTSRKPELSGMITAGMKDENGTSRAGAGFNFPMDYVYDVEFPVSPTAPSGWETQEWLNRPVSILVSPLPKGDALPPPAIAQALDALEKSQPVDMIADAMYSTNSIRVVGLTASDRPLGETLTRIAFEARHRWEYQDGFVRIRSSHYALDRRAEPTFGKLKKWAAFTDQDAQNIDNLSEIAAQPYPAFSTTEVLLSDLGKEYGRRISGQTRNHLAFWNALSPSQRLAAKSSSGLKCSSRLKNFKETFVLAATDRFAAEGLGSSKQDDEWSQDDVMGGSFHATFVVGTMWGFKTDSGYSARGGLREEVLKRFQKEHPELTPEQIMQGRSTVVRFEYRANGHTKASCSIGLPLVWEKDAGK